MKKQHKMPLPLTGQPYEGKLQWVETSNAQKGVPRKMPDGFTVISFGRIGDMDAGLAKKFAKLLRE